MNKHINEIQKQILSSNQYHSCIDKRRIIEERFVISEQEYISIKNLYRQKREIGRGGLIELSTKLVQLEHEYTTNYSILTEVIWLSEQRSRWANGYLVG